MVFISTDVLTPYNREIVSTDSYPTLIDFLQDMYPNGFERPTDISINTKTLEVNNYDTALKEDDIIVLLERAALPAALFGGSLFLTALANLTISVTLSYVVNKLFAPDAADTGSSQPSSVYNLNSAQNMARYGAPIPIIYGTVRMYPAMIVQPYYKFENNIEYLYHVLCVGQGTNTTDNIQIAEDDITTPGDLQWKLLYQDSFYNIPRNAYGIHITRTLSSPSNLELKEGEFTEEYTIKQGTANAEFDYHYPNGIYATRAEGGYNWAATAFSYYIKTLAGVTLFEGRVTNAGMSKDPIQATVNKFVGNWTQTEAVTISFYTDVTLDDPGYSETGYIKRVKEIYPNKDFTQAYGDITLLVCKIKATNAVSSIGQVKVNGYFTREDVGNSMEEVLTDIYTNTTYGGALNASDLNFPVTGACVNAAYDSNQTIFDAMRKPALAQGFSLFLAGQDVILKKDGVNNITTGLYNEMNIIRNSLKVQYLFKEEYPSYDGFETTYLDSTWTQQTELYPSWSVRPQKVDLFGVAGDCIEPVLYPFHMRVISPTVPGYNFTDGAAAMTDNGDGSYDFTSFDPISAILATTNKEDQTRVEIIRGDSLYSLYTAWSDCTGLTSFDGRGLTNCSLFRYTWWGCTGLLHFNTAGMDNASDVAHAWYQCSGLLSFDSSALISIINFSWTWHSCTSLICINKIDTTSATNKSSMFDNCPALAHPDTIEQADLTDTNGANWVNPNPCP